MPMMTRLKVTSVLKLLTSLLLVATIPAHAKEATLFEIDGKWRAASGEAFAWKDLANKNTIVTMAYTHCASSCPISVHLMKKLAKEAAEKSLDLRFVIISLDPKRDTPERMRHFQKSMGINLPGWSLVVGDDANTRRLAMALGVHYTKVPESEEILHNNVIVTLDDSGRIVKRVEGLKASLADVLPL